MNLTKFYSQSLEDAKNVLDRELHYHVPNKDNVGENMFADYVRDFYKYIDNNSSILDCGSGWGGPARQLIKEKNCSVEGITISQEQADYTNQFFPTHCINLTEFIPDKTYDVAIFIQSYFHLSQDEVSITLNNLKNYVKNILICDFEYNYIGYPENPITIGPWKEWRGYRRLSSQYYKEFSTSTFQIESFERNPGNFIDANKFWLTNLNKLSNLNPQWELLKQSAKNYLSADPTKEMSTMSLMSLFAKNNLLC